ncbi:hypothetical protein MRX96_044024 [Rhipicephalus microplus]
MSGDADKGEGERRRRCKSKAEARLFSSVCERRRDRRLTVVRPPLWVVLCSLRTKCLLDGGGLMECNGRQGARIVESTEAENAFLLKLKSLPVSVSEGQKLAYEHSEKMERCMVSLGGLEEQKKEARTYWGEPVTTNVPRFIAFPPARRGRAPPSRLSRCRYSRCAAPASPPLFRNLAPRSPISPVTLLLGREAHLFGLPLATLQGPLQHHLCGCRAVRMRWPYDFELKPMAPPWRRGSVVRVKDTWRGPKRRLVLSTCLLGFRTGKEAAILLSDGFLGTLRHRPHFVSFGATFKNRLSCLFK